jgi:predicted nucleic acid-binding protein
MGYLAVLKRNIHTISVLPTEECFQRAKELSPDPKDALYFAIALKLKIGIWTNDKRLRDQTEISILGTSELVEQNYHKSNP